MWQLVAILVGGYGLIALSFAWVRCLAYGASQSLSARRSKPTCKKDARLIISVMMFWTCAWVILVIEDCGA